MQWGAALDRLSVERRGALPAAAVDLARLVYSVSVFLAGNAGGAGVHPQVGVVTGTLHPAVPDRTPMIPVRTPRVSDDLRVPASGVRVVRTAQRPSSVRPPAEGLSAR